METKQATLQINFGAGILETLTSALYDNPVVVFREYVQNSIDAYNDTILKDSKKSFDDFKIEINIDHETKQICIKDNGYGIEYQEFDSTIMSIGNSKKKTAPQIGFRGIGRLSALPFCKKIFFINKAKGSDRIQICRWKGEEYFSKLLQYDDIDLASAIASITTIKTMKSSQAKDDHFFYVLIKDYNVNLDNIIGEMNSEFKMSLCKLLPLHYCDSFTKKADIIKQFKQVTGLNLDSYSYPIVLNGERLFKLYTDENILNDGIHFWDIKIQNKSVGIIWFTFNLDFKSVKKLPELTGIYTRSKNMLMGDSLSLIKNYAGYVSTERELRQTLQAVYGELLIDTGEDKNILKDNARRDWFRMDEGSIELANIIGEFLKGIYKYRYAASRVLNAKSETVKLKMDYEKAYNDMTVFTNDRLHDKVTGESYNTFIKKYGKDYTPPEPTRADEDIPKKAKQIRDFYNIILECLAEYFKKDLKTFMEIRDLLKRKLNAKSED